MQTKLPLCGGYRFAVFKQKSPLRTRGVEGPTVPWQLKLQNLTLPLVPLPWQLDALPSYTSRSKNVRFHWRTLYNMYNSPLQNSMSFRLHTNRAVDYFFTIPHDPKLINSPSISYLSVCIIKRSIFIIHINYSRIPASLVFFGKWRSFCILKSTAADNATSFNKLNVSLTVHHELTIH